MFFQNLGITTHNHNVPENAEGGIKEEHHESIIMCFPPFSLFDFFQMSSFLYVFFAFNCTLVPGLPCRCVHRFVMMVAVADIDFYNNFLQGYY